MSCLTILQNTEFVCYRIPRINSLPYVMMSCLKCLVSVTHKRLPTVDTVTGLILCQCYVPEKHAANRTQNSHLKTVYFLGVRGLTASSSTVYDYTTRGYKDL